MQAELGLNCRQCWLWVTCIPGERAIERAGERAFERAGERALERAGELGAAAHVFRVLGFQLSADSLEIVHLSTFSGIEIYNDGGYSQMP